MRPGHRAWGKRAEGEPALHFVRGLSLAGFHKIAVWEWGAGHPGVPVVCVHGLTRQARDFDALARRLAGRGRRVLCVDLVGRGRSDWLDDPQQYHLVQYAADVNAVLAWAHAEAVDWVGTSLGGLVGITLAAQSGDTPIRRMVLNDVGPYIPSRALLRIGRSIGAEVLRFASLDEAGAYLRTVLQPFGDLSDAEWLHFARHSFRREEDGGAFVPRCDPAIARTYRQWQYLNVDIWRTWRQIRCPVLVLRGADSDFLLPEIVARMCESGDVRAIEVPGCGHAPSLLRTNQIEPVTEFFEGDV